MSARRILIWMMWNAWLAILILGGILGQKHPLECPIYLSWSMIACLFATLHAGIVSLEVDLRYVPIIHCTGDEALHCEPASPLLGDIGISVVT